MAKSFSNIKKGLGLLDFIPIGKYKTCRVDSIIEQDSDYLIFMDKEKILVFLPEVLDALKNKFSASSIAVANEAIRIAKYYYNKDDYYDDDVPF
jgi:hypothetical protein